MESIASRRMFFRGIACTVLIVLLATQAWSGERRYAAEIDTALGLLGLTAADFESDRIWAEDDTFLLPVIREAMRGPLHADSVLREFSFRAGGTVPDGRAVGLMGEFIDAPAPLLKDLLHVRTGRAIDWPLPAAVVARPSKSPKHWESFQPTLEALLRAAEQREAAFARYSPEQREALRLALPLWFEDEDILEDDTLKGALHRAFGMAVDTARKVDADSVLTLLSLVDRPALTTAAYCLALAAERAEQAARAARFPRAKTRGEGVEGQIIAIRDDLPIGRCVIGGPGPNVYHGDFALIIDVGGDDRYLGHTGGAAGGLGRAVSLIVDLAGNDRYVASGMVSQGAGVMGVGALVDLAGNDVYEGGAFSQGAAFCGAGMLFDEGGDDTYRAGLFAQGAAVCGLAVLADGAGRDVYDLAMYGQGFGGTFAAGTLVDRSGNDLYRAGGVQLHTPLLPEDYRSFAQGFAIGSRPRGGGGIGLLHDYEGNDFYIAEVYAQGVGYWYSLGGLLDDAGNDVYSATQYVQGAGIHLAAGVLVDGGGDDRYGSRHGPGQGGAHDLAVGLLFDHGGDDYYTISGGQAMAINNSAALFYDAAGNDFYNTWEPVLGQGGVYEGRGFGSLGVFVDGEGRDIYPTHKRADSTAWLPGVFSVGYDVAYDSLRPREAPVEIELNPADTLRSVEDLFHDAALWEVTDNRIVVKRARLALDVKWAEAIPWVAKKKLSSVESLERRAMVELFKPHPEAAGPRLVAALDTTTDRATRRNVVSIIGEMKYRPALPALLARLDDTSFVRLRPSMLSAMGELGDSSAVPTLTDYAARGTERERIAAVISLGKLRAVQGFPALLAGLGDPVYTVRSAAITALSAQSPTVFETLTHEGEQALSPVRRELLLLVVSNLAARWKSGADSIAVPRLAPLVRKGLDHPEPRVQGAALTAAANVLGEAELRRLLTRYESSSDPVLRARVKQVQLTLK